jgi:hypothetical protein
MRIDLRKRPYVNAGVSVRNILILNTNYVPMGDKKEKAVIWLRHPRGAKFMKPRV